MGKKVYKKIHVSKIYAIDSIEDLRDIVQEWDDANTDTPASVETVDVCSIYVYAWRHENDQERDKRLKEQRKIKDAKKKAKEAEEEKERNQLRRLLEKYPDLNNKENDEKHASQFWLDKQ